MAKFVCADCGQAYPAEGLPHLCPLCGGVFTLQDLQYNPRAKQALPGIWEYKNLMGADKNPVCYLGEGKTSLVEREYNGTKFFAKLESLNPSGSFKDRNSAIVTSFLKARGIQNVVEDSSGNAGASLALYSAGFDIKSKIFIPAGTTGAKVEQIIISGALVEPVAGPRNNAHLAAMADLDTSGTVYASHAMLPFGMAAYATIAFEIFEQLGELPAKVYCPIGHGSLFLGILLGFNAIGKYLGLDTRPGMIGVQPERCSPLVSAWNKQDFVPSALASIAEGTMVVEPIRKSEILKELHPDLDDLVAIPEDQIEPARSELAKMGIYVEPTSAMVFSALKMKKTPNGGINILVFSGNGLKYHKNTL